MGRDIDKFSIPTENPNKYGRFDDDLSELATGLNGGVPVRDRAYADRVESSGTDTLDEDFLRTLGNPVNKYGK